MGVLPGEFFFIPRIWSGGFASHGLLFGGASVVLIFCLIRRVPIRPVFDLLAISAAIIPGFGRIGNFIDGQIFGTLTDLPWGVEFPGADGFRHSVMLYDGIKNFLLVPVLLWVRSTKVPPGKIAVLFVILYPLLRIPNDSLREYPISLWGLPTGQELNVVMVLTALVLLAINILRSRDQTQETATLHTTNSFAGIRWRRAALILCCTIPLLIPSDATRDVPATYLNRHANLHHSWMYQDIQKQLNKSGPR